MLTIGVPDAPSEPTVTIAGVTVTGGATVGNLAPESGRGGGIYSPAPRGRPPAPPSRSATALSAATPSLRAWRSIPPTRAARSRLRRRRDLQRRPDRRRHADQREPGRPRVRAGQQRDRRRNPQPRLRDADGQAQRRHAQPRRRDPAERPLRRRRRHRGRGGTLTITDSRVSDNSADTLFAVPSGVDEQATPAASRSRATPRDDSPHDIRQPDEFDHTLGDVVAFSAACTPTRRWCDARARQRQPRRRHDRRRLNREGLRHSAPASSTQTTRSGTRGSPQHRHRDVLPKLRTPKPADLDRCVRAHDDQRQRHQPQPRDRDLEDGSGPSTAAASRTSAY